MILHKFMHAWSGFCCINNAEVSVVAIHLCTKTWLVPKDLVTYILLLVSHSQTAIFLLHWDRTNVKEKIAVWLSETILLYCGKVDGGHAKFGC